MNNKLKKQHAGHREHWKKLVCSKQAARIHDATGAEERLVWRGDGFWCRNRGEPRKKRLLKCLLIKGGTTFTVAEVGLRSL